MKTITWLPNYRAAVGRTIDKIVTEVSSLPDTVVMLFMDGTALCLRSRIVDEYDSCIEFYHPHPDTDFSQEMRVELGLMTPEELARRKLGHAEMMRQHQESMERATLERLKAKYGDK